ncbi:MAG TPA: chromosome partitioning protein ParB, partial [Burkholderiaceae bacterium]|nr:chromosome partitioning protein ParB [Burkholderiaceae bacterium]
GDLDMGHARALVPLDKAHQITCANQIVAKKLSVREAEKLVQRGDGGRQTPLLRMKGEHPRDIARIEEQLADWLTAKVEIRVKKQGRGGPAGEVAIAFGSLDELNGLLDKLGLKEA